MAETAFTPPPEIADTAAWHRLQSQRSYYSKRAGDYQKRYKLIKLALITLSGAIPIVAFLPEVVEPRYIVAAIGVVIAVLEGVLLLNQYSQLWIKYRRTAEGLKREEALLLADAGDYKALPRADALRLLAERTETLVSEENAQWAELQAKAVAQVQEFADRLRPPAAKAD